jgi:spermidine synthase
MLLFREKDPFSFIDYSYQIEEILCRRKSKYSDIMVLRSHKFGKMLIIDNVVQLTELDEHLYHEMLVHVPLHIHPSPGQIAIVGGGDGGTLREVLKHKEAEEVVLVEVDKEVIQVSKTYLPTLSSGFRDPRVEVVIMDGANFMKTVSKEFDIILVDSTDPVGIAESIFTDRFFKDVSSCLRPDGIFVTQTESLHFHLDFVRDIQQKLASCFRFVDLYTISTPTYAGNWWTFSIASKGRDLRRDPKKCNVITKYYAEDVHINAFLPQSLKERLLL